MIVCDKNITLDELDSIELIRPSRAGRVWQGIPHAELAGAIHDDITMRGWTVEQSSFSVTKDKAGMAGAFDITIPNLAAPEGQRFSVGFITSNNMRRSLKLVVGTRVFVCNNGQATGELLLQHKHTNQFDIYSALETAMDGYMEKAAQINSFVESLHARELSQEESDLLLMETGRRGVMPWSHVGMVDREYHNPTYTEHNEKTSFGLLQAFTHICKKSPPMEQMDRMSLFRELLPSNPRNN